MPQARVWVEAADKAIISMRASGCTWAAIARTLSLSRNTVIERGRRLQAAAPLRRPEIRVERPLSDDANRPALPAGHPLTWGLLTDEPYPHGDEK